MIAGVLPMLVTLAFWEVSLPATTLPKFKLAGENRSESCWIPPEGWPFMLPTHPAVKLADKMASTIANSAHVKFADLALGPLVVVAVRPVNLMLIALSP
jgi:hypothetical protein